MSVPWPLAVFMVAPFGIPAAVGVYLLVRDPKPYFIAIPFLYAGVVAVAYVTDRRYRRHAQRVVAASFFLFETYLFTVAALYIGGATFAAVVLVLGLTLTPLIVWKGVGPSRGLPWGRPHDPPGDTRWTSPF